MYHNTSCTNEIKILSQEFNEFEKIREIITCTLLLSDHKCLLDHVLSLFCQKLEDENDHLKLKIEDLQRQLTERNMSHDQENSELLRLEDQLGSKVTELYEIHEQIISLIRKESHS